jgi:hypothetical protein
MRRGGPDAASSGGRLVRDRESLARAVRVSARATSSAIGLARHPMKDRSGTARGTSLLVASHHDFDRGTVEDRLRAHRFSCDSTLTVAQTEKYVGGEPRACVRDLHRVRDRALRTVDRASRNRQTSALGGEAVAPSFFDLRREESNLLVSSPRLFANEPDLLISSIRLAELKPQRQACRDGGDA